MLSKNNKYSIRESGGISMVISLEHLMLLYQPIHLLLSLTKTPARIVIHFTMDALPSIYCVVNLS